MKKRELLTEIRYWAEAKFDYETWRYQDTMLELNYVKTKILKIKEEINQFERKQILYDLLSDPSQIVIKYLKE